MTSNIEYLGNLRTEATHLKSGTKIITDAPTDNRGKGKSFSPTDLVATALGSCIVTIMGIKAMDNLIDITGTTCTVNKIMAAAPRRIAKVEITIQMPKKDYTDEEKKLLEAVAQSCPVCRSLSPEMEKAVIVNW